MPGYDAAMLVRLMKSNVSLALFAAGFFCSSWDLLAKIKAGGFTLKLYQPLFFLCAASLLYWRRDRLAHHLAPLARSFAFTFLALTFFYLGLAPWSAFPLKSFLYSCWLLFDILCVWLSVQLLFEEAPAEFFSSVALVTLLFLSSIILVDYVAYPFGYRGGLIGNNQDILTNLMISRPHAFSSEPSYAAAYLCLGFFTVVPFTLHRAKRKWLAGLGAALILFAIVATTSRSGWAALAMGLGLLAVLPVAAGRKFPWKPVAAIAGALPVLVGIFVLTTPQAQKDNLNHLLIGTLFSGNDSSGNSRMKAFALAADMAKETHFVGTGLGASYRFFREHGGFDYNFQGVITDRENGNEVIMSTWGQLVAEGGLVAPLLYLLAGFVLARALWREWRGTGSALAYGSLVAALLTFGFLAFWLGNVARGDLWVWYALWSGFATQLSRKPQPL
jgi:O-antigen ligase